MDHPTNLNRRGFLGRAGAVLSGLAGARLAAGAPGRGAPAAPFDILDQKPWREQTRRLKVTRGGRPVASLIFPTDYPTHFRLKPELHQVCTPSGLPVTGSHEYCFIHQQSIQCGHGKVQLDGDDRVIDFYRQLPFPDFDRTDPHRPVGSRNNLYQLGPSGIQRITGARWRGGEQVVIQLDLDWQTRELGGKAGESFLREERFYRIASVPNGTLVDVFSELSPADRPVTLIPENDHGYIGVRVHDFIDVDDGGVTRDSEGRTNAFGHFRSAEAQPRVGTPSAPSPSMGAPPRWVDCTGKIGDSAAGMALMSHPANLRNEWYVREFGLMIISAAQSAPVRITAAQPFKFAVRFLAHDGILAPEAADRLQAEFSAVTADAMRSFVEG